MKIVVQLVKYWNQMYQLENISNNIIDKDCTELSDCVFKKSMLILNFVLLE